MILHIVPSIAEEASGPSYSVGRTCESLAALGESVCLATLDWAPLLHTPSFLKVFPLGFGPRRLGRSPQMKDWMAAQASAGGLDVIHSHGLWMMPNVYPGDIAAKWRVPLVVSPRGTMSNWAFTRGAKVKQLFWPLLQRPSLRSVSCFHATAASECEDVRAHGFRQPVAVIPNGVDVPTMLPRVFGSSRTLLFLGRLHPKKGVEVLLSAWQAIQDRFSDWRLQIVGPDQGGHSLHLRAMAADLGLKRVDFKGAVYGQAKNQSFRDADLFVLPTYSENFGMAVAESLAMGTPAVVSKGAPWQGLEANGAGWWIDIGVDPLVACLENALASSPEQLAAMGRAGRAWMERDYSWGRVARQMAHTYQWLLDGGAKPEWVMEG